MEDALKDSLVEQFRSYLDGVGETPSPSEAAGSEADLFTLFVELAALRTEVRAEIALGQGHARSVPQYLPDRTIEPGRSGAGTAVRARARAGTGAGFAARPAGSARSPCRRAATSAGAATALAGALAPGADASNRALAGRAAHDVATLDRILHDHRVTPIEMLGRRFDPHLGRVVATRRARARDRRRDRAGRGPHRLPVGRFATAPGGGGGQ